MIEKLFFKTKITWLRVVLSAVGTGVIVAAFLILPVFTNTSFRAPGETPEFWLFPALVIVLNAATAKEAMAKTFVFFLISQPVIYLVQVPFTLFGWQIFAYYPFWFMITVLTIPAAWLAFRARRGGIFGGLVFGLAEILLAVYGVSSLKILYFEFPRYLLAALYCFGFMVLMNIYFLKQKRSRMISVIIAAAATVTVAALIIFMPSDGELSYPLPDGEGWQVIACDEQLTAAVEEDSLRITGHVNGEYVILLEDEDGCIVSYSVHVSGGHHYIDVVTEE